MSSNFMGLPAGFASDSPFPPLRSPAAQMGPQKQQQQQQQQQALRAAASVSRPRPPLPRPQVVPGYGRPQSPGPILPSPQLSRPQQPVLPPLHQSSFSPTSPHAYSSPIMSNGSQRPLQHEHSLRQAHSYHPGLGPPSNGSLPLRRAPSQPATRLEAPLPHQQHRVSAPMLTTPSTYPGSPVLQQSRDSPIFSPSQYQAPHAPGSAPVGGLPMPMPMPAPFQPMSPTPARSPTSPAGNGYPSRQNGAPQPQHPPRRSDASLRPPTNVQSIGAAVEEMWPFNRKGDADSPAPAASDRSGHSQGRASEMARQGSLTTTSSHTSNSSTASSIVIFLPQLADLGKLKEEAWAARDEQRMLQWCRHVLQYVERRHETNRISEPILVGYIDQAMKTIKQLCALQDPLPEALYVRGDLLNSGAFPSYYRKDLKAAFNDFELSARNGYAPSWFRLGRDYELLGDMQHARDAYERGCSVQDVGSIYRMGMANLLGQLELTVDYDMAMPLLKEAADLSTTETPQPSYVYGMLLIGEFSQIKIPEHLLDASPDPQRPGMPATIEGEARRRIQRSAYLNFPPAQYRCGWQYEYALLECPFDPLRSVEYYSLASQGGEIEADLALSKWFLCGAEGCFEKNEQLAFTFADKAAKKGLPSAEFAMGYYCEVGVGCQPDISMARDWYERAAAHDNEDAKERLSALKNSQANLLSRKQHEQHVSSQLQRKRTEAKHISDKRRQEHPSQMSNGKSALGVPSSLSNGGPASSMIANLDGHTPSAMPRQSAELRRAATMRLVEDLAYSTSRHGSAPRLDAVPQRTQEPAAGRVDGLPMPATGAPPFMPSPRPASHSTQPSQASSTRTATAGGRPPSTASTVTKGAASSNMTVTSANGKILPTPSKASAQSSPKPPSSIVVNAYGQTPGATNGHGPGSSSSGSSAAGSQGSKRVYETFSEMGFKSSKTTDDRDCVIC